MVHERQRLLLSLLQALGGKVANTDFQKLLFVFVQEFQAVPAYDFVPYKFGGFSFTSYADKRRLAESGLLEEDENEWKLTSNGKRCSRPDHPIAVALNKFVRKYGALRGERLLSDVYERYPYYATRSEILEKVVTNQETRGRIERARPECKSTGLLTIGYEGKSLEGYLNQLIRENVSLLCDVRRNPISRKYGFSKGTLSAACEKLCIRYEHLQELGIASDERQSLHSQADYDALFADYERTTLPGQNLPLEKLTSWLRNGEKVALTCFELDPRQCHRRCVADALVKRIGRSIGPRHLGEVCLAKNC
jgi:uncharacterized protein (DUF488 family)